MATLRIEIIDQPGVMSTITKVIGQTGGNIMDITHHRMFIDLPVKRAEVDVLVETRNANHVAEIIEKLEQAGFSTRRLSSRSGEG
jgi:threonine dehydratase